jgi:hypothetical protein
MREYFLAAMGTMALLRVDTEPVKKRDSLRISEAK